MVIMALTSPVAADIIFLYFFRLQRSRARAGPNFGPGMTDEPPPGQPPGRRAAAAAAATVTVNRRDLIQ
jgi:hypothetical protein